MMRKRSFLSDMKMHLAAGALAFAVTLVAAAPASILSAFIDHDTSRISYSSVSGTIWSGLLKDASLAGAPLGDVSFTVSPWSLLRFSPEIALSANGGAAVGELRVSVSPGKKLSVRDATADIEVAAIAPRGVFGEPAFGLAKIAIAKLTVSEIDGCLEGRGEIWTDVLNAPAKRFNLPALPMSGGVACDGGDLVITLSGENARAGAEVVLRVERTMAYEIVATARPAEESTASALRVFGFEDDNGTLTYGSVGVFRGAGS